jgi:hypothetical protein
VIDAREGDRFGGQHAPALPVLGVIAGSGQPVRIVFADDDEAQRRLLRRLLEIVPHLDQRAPGLSAPARPAPDDLDPG